jgi:hypothetical protein
MGKKSCGAAMAWLHGNFYLLLQWLVAESSGAQEDCCGKGAHNPGGRIHNRAAFLT